MADSVIYNSSINEREAASGIATHQTRLQFHTPPAHEWYRLVVHGKNVVLVHQVEHARAKAHGWNGVCRARIEEFSDKSRLGLKQALQAARGLTHWVVLTYSGCYPSDGQVVKGHITKLRRALYDKGFGGIWVLEFQERGAVHINFLLTRQPDLCWLKRKWAGIVGGCDHRHEQYGVWVQAIQNSDCVGTYLTKLRSKQVPEGFQNVGRFWSHFGDCVPKPMEVMCGTVDEVVPVFEALLDEENKRRTAHGYPVRKRGHRFGFTSWGTAGALGAVMRRLFWYRRSPSPMRQSLSSVHTMELWLCGRITKMWMDYMVRMRNTWHKWKSHHLPC